MPGTKPGKPASGACPTPMAAVGRRSVAFSMPRPLPIGAADDSYPCIYKVCVHPSRQAEVLGSWEPETQEGIRGRFDLREPSFRGLPKGIFGQVRRSQLKLDCEGDTSASVLVSQGERDRLEVRLATVGNAAFVRESIDWASLLRE